MRKAFQIALVLTLVVAAGANAQTIGLKAGPSFSKFNVSGFTGGEPELGTLAGLGVGVFAQWGHSVVKLQAEAMFLTKGSKILDSSNDSVSAKLKLNYIEIPVEVLIQTKAGPYLYGGPAIAFEANCISEVKVGSITVSSTCNDNNTPIPDRKKVDVSAVGGVGYRYVWKRRVITLEARGEFGLTNIDETAGDGEVRNRTFAIMLGYTATRAH